jgi:hyaluronan synthase
VSSSGTELHPIVAEELGGSLVKVVRDPWYWIVYGAILAGILALIHAHLHGVLLRPLVAAAETHHWARFLIFPSMLWIVMGTLLLVFRTAVWMAYHPFPSATFDGAPQLTVIIPAYNEGPMVLKSIESVVAAIYPHDRLEIFVVDDGSRDDTWKYIKEAATRWPELVRPVRFAKNQGKRAAPDSKRRAAT